MQLGMNSNKSADTLAGSAPFSFSCLFWLAAMFALAWLLLRRLAGCARLNCPSIFIAFFDFY